MLLQSYIFANNLLIQGLYLVLQKVLLFALQQSLVARFLSRYLQLAKFQHQLFYLQLTLSQ